jgi:Fe-S-cluster containining protein
MTCDPTNSNLFDAVSRAGQCAEFMAAVASLYADVDHAIAQHELTCLGGGTCCRFDVAGHRLYVSTGELAFLLASPWPHESALPLRCPYQQGPLCRARSHRPLGCRTFFCRQTDSTTLDMLYERMHTDLKSLHDQYCIAYHYVEISSGLASWMSIDDDE